MDKKQQQQQNNSGGGFLLGLILGVLIALLVTTKRGRQLLKEWTEKGIDKLSDLENIMSKHEAKRSTQSEESDYVEKKPEQKEQERKLIAQEVEIVEEKPIAKPKMAPNQEPLPEIKSAESKTDATKKPTITHRFFKRK